MRPLRTVAIPSTPRLRNQLGLIPQNPHRPADSIELEFLTPTTCEKGLLFFLSFRRLRKIAGRTVSLTNQSARALGV